VSKKRTATIIRSNGTKHIAIDDDNKEEIKKFLKSNQIYQDKFQKVIEIILNNLKVPDLFDKEDIDGKSKDVWAMKFLKGGNNARLYCKEVRTKDSQYIIVAVIPLEKKKNQKNKSVEKSLIQKVASYDYEILTKPKLTLNTPKSGK